jgi:hypothetical protein
MYKDVSRKFRVAYRGGSNPGISLRFPSNQFAADIFQRVAHHPAKSPYNYFMAIGNSV